MSSELGTRILGMVVRAFVSAVNDSGAAQKLGLTVLSDEPRSDVERVQNYGLTSNPPTGTKCVGIAIGGNRERLLIIATDHEGRPINLLAGEVKVYNSVTGEEIFFKADGTILLGKDAVDPVVRKSDLDALITKYNTHTHSVATTGTAAAQTGTAAATAATHTGTASAKVFAK